jgi:hypothetical protein
MRRLLKVGLLAAALGLLLAGPGCDRGSRKPTAFDPNFKPTRMPKSSPPLPPPP